MASTVQDMSSAQFDSQRIHTAGTSTRLRALASSLPSQDGSRSWRIHTPPRNIPPARSAAARANADLSGRASFQPGTAARRCGGRHQVSRASANGHLLRRTGADTRETRGCADAAASPSPANSVSVGACSWADDASVTKPKLASSEFSEANRKEGI